MRNVWLRRSLPLLVGFASVSATFAQQAITAAPVDPAIARAIAQIDPDKVYADIEKLVAPAAAPAKRPPFRIRTAPTAAANVARRIA